MNATNLTYQHTTDYLAYRWELGEDYAVHMCPLTTLMHLTECTIVAGLIESVMAAAALIKTPVVVPVGHFLEWSRVAVVFGQVCALMGTEACQVLMTERRVFSLRVYVVDFLPFWV